MIRNTYTLDNESLTIDSQPLSRSLQLWATILAAAAIVASTFHFRPYENSKTWQMLNPSNSAVILWILILTAYVIVKRPNITALLPHISIFAYLFINLLSGAFAPEVSRAATFTAKLALMLVGGYILFSSAITSKKSLHIIYSFATITVLISIVYCLISRLASGSESFGFFDSPYKYGTYIGILAPLSAAYLLSGPQIHTKLLAIIIITGALISAGSIITWAAILIGMVTLVIITKSRLARIIAIGSLAAGFVLVWLLSSNPAVAPLKEDMKFAEQDKTNLKQRYIEWQAEMNLLEERTIAGTGAGSINEFRSNYYYRLPKLNTLKAFDQNGWLATAAEAGILGLVTFCWIIVYYFGLAFRQLAEGSSNHRDAHRFAAANFAGLAAACIANTNSSVHYNGVVIVFILILALISRTKVVFSGEKQ